MHIRYSALYKTTVCTEAPGGGREAAPPPATSTCRDLQSNTNPQSGSLCGSGTHRSAQQFLPSSAGNGPALALLPSPVGFTSALPPHFPSPELRAPLLPPPSPVLLAGRSMCLKSPRFLVSKNGGGALNQSSPSSSVLPILRVQGGPGRRRQALRGECMALTLVR